MKPAAFVASSLESVELARAIQDNLDRDVDVAVWDQGIMSAGGYTLDQLLERSAEFDFGIFVLAPDDVVNIRQHEKPAARDNVVFEFGLFIGALGRHRTFLVFPRDVANLRLPSDFTGLNGADYEAARLSRGDSPRLVLGSACNQLRSRIQQESARLVRGLTPDLVLLLRYLERDDRWTLPDFYGKALAVANDAPDDISGEQLRGWKRAVRYGLLHLSHLGLAQQAVDTSVTYTISPKGRRILSAAEVQRAFATSFQRELRTLSGKDL